MNRKIPKILIDTDAGHDDALALMLLIKSGLFDIQAIITVAGNSNIENVTRNAQAILDLLEISNIPLHSGSEKPLERPLVQAVVHGTSGLDGLDISKTRYSLTHDGVDVIIKKVLNSSEKITILTLGPLTNIAQAFIKEPNIVNNIKEIVIMGGAITVPGNKNRVAEFNIFVDPEAADVVFRARVEKILIPLDPCNETVISLDTFDDLIGTNLYHPLKSMMRHFIAGIEKDEGVKGALVYDAIAAYYLLNPGSFELESMNVVIETKGEHTVGMTVAEKRLTRKKDVNVKIANKVNSDAFVKDLFNILRKK